MDTSARRPAPTRESILDLLSDDEMACIAAREVGPPLAAGEEYVDLHSLDEGVRYAEAGARVAKGDLVPRASLESLTWSRICSRLASSDPRRP